jgi:hypothetical protein
MSARRFEVSGDLIKDYEAATTACFAEDVLVLLGRPVAHDWIRVVTEKGVAHSDPP